MAPLIYPGGDEQQTLNLGLATWGMDEVLAQNMILIDAFAAGPFGTSIKINGSVIPSPNFISSASVTFSVAGSNVSATAASGVIPGGSPGDIQYNNAGVFGGSAATITAAGSLTIPASQQINDSNGDFLAFTPATVTLQDSAGDSLVLTGVSNSITLTDVNGDTLSIGDGVITLQNNGSPSQRVELNGPTFYVFGGINLAGTLTDATSSAGTSGQVLSSTVTGTKWVTPSAGGGTVTLTAVAPTVTAGQVGLGSTTNFTIGANGGAAGLTALPVGYIIINVGGTNYQIPYYNV
jgi:hypothetical protein